MGRIQLLSEQVSSRIAAGEVVERPASIVKELVENAIDAMSTAISIHIEDGGVREIRVADNGEGIVQEDMPLTIVKHATSKIYTLADLEHIYSMGFRGEALSSIAAVSMLSIKSRTKQSDAGTELFVRGGKVEYIRQAGLPEGTTVTVENLFYNTPARLKFLKKHGMEAAAVSEIVLRLILARPDISFRYSVSDKTVFHSPGNGALIDAIYTVYGFSLRDFLLKVDYKLNNIKITGYISSPSTAYKTQKYGTIFINSRYIKSPLIHETVLHAYGERILKGNFPLYVLNIDINTADIDVNVHPNKLTVHFRDENEITYSVLNAVSEALSQNRFSPALEIQKQPSAPNFVKKKEVLDLKTVSSEQQEIGEDELKKAVDEVLNLASKPHAKVLFVREPTPFEVIENKEAQEKILQNMVFSPSNSLQGEPQRADLFSKIEECSIIGVAFSSYIIVESGSAIYFIDQHAAHERKIYDALMNNTAKKHISQKLLMPVKISVTPEEKFLIAENMGIMESMGFEIANLEDIFCEISAVPLILGEVNVREVFQDILASLEAGKLSPELRKDKIAKGACKRAVKAGNKMSAADVRELVHTIITSGSIPNCPHGRPIAISITKKQLEIGFKRRV